jgi:RecA/RadA recombinase
MGTPQRTPFVVGRQSEVQRLDDLLAGRTSYWLLNIYGPGGIGKTAVGHKLTAHAQTRGTPVSIVDGTAAKTSTDLLAGFVAGLVGGAGGERLEDAFRPFDQQWRDYRAINEVLQRGGGLPALFESTGSVTDPAKMATLLDRLGQPVSAAVRETLGDRFAIERYVRGAERLLTSGFVDGLGAAIAQVHDPILLLIDTYENLENVDGWICSSLVPALPSGVRLIMLGRNQLHRVNFDWSDYGEAINALPLPELSEDEAKAYLQYYGLTDPAALNQIYQFTGGYPLLLVLVRHLSHEAGGWEQVGTLQSNADRDFVATQLLERILSEERALEVRAFLEQGVVASWFDPETISVLLGVGLDEGRQIYEKLRRHSFVERHPNGLKFHDKIRELLLARLQFTSQAEYRRLNRRLIDYYAEKAGIDQATPIELRLNAQAQRCADLDEHIHKTLGLLNQYEELRRLSSDPKEQQRAVIEIDDQRTQLAAYEREQRDLGCGG